MYLVQKREEGFLKFLRNIRNYTKKDYAKLRDNNKMDLK